ncbi:MAG: hypothetical protein JKY95_07410 [Planctomycetaceae bacterium]|nr:hypothetical protein [Planctomycetaceae bacterium]
MNDHSQQPLQFKFHWLNDKGHPTSMMRKKGRFEGETITLEEAEIPVAAIVNSSVREKKFAIVAIAADEQEEYVTLLIQLPSKKLAESLKKEMDLARSALWAKQHQKELEEKGLGHTFRQEQCPRCTATLILSDMPQSPQLYCHFCDSLSTIDPNSDPIPQERDLRVCEECSMYTRPQKFTIFYFYFLLVIYGFSSSSTWRCPPCMRGEAWKMLFGNLLFVLGVPTAIWQLVRSYGGSSVGGPFKGLDTGNIKARKGDLAGALESYRNILENVPISAGVKYNLGMAVLAQGNLEKAAETFEIALQDCSNYVPAYSQLHHLLQQLGETEKLTELEQMWSSGTEQTESEPEEIQTDLDEQQ